MPTKFKQMNDMFLVQDARASIVHDKLPPAVYTLNVSQDIGFYLVETENFELPKKLYGEVEKDATRILTSFAHRDGSTGVLLTGERGSGKTMLAKKTSLMGQALGIPTILVSSPYCGDSFNAFIQSIEQDAIVLFDEFEKVYGDEEQIKLLTLLDGTIKTKKLFIFTSNDKFKINAHMQNRPGRIFYMKEYSGISVEFIEEYCRDVLKPELQKYTEMVCQFASMFFAFNFDMLKAICEEMNRYNESPRDAIILLNTKPGFSKVNINYDVVIHNLDGSQIAKTAFTGHPLAGEEDTFAVRAWTQDGQKFSEDVRSFFPDMPFDRSPTGEDIKSRNLQVTTISFSTDDIVSVDKNGNILMKNENNLTALLTKTKAKEYDPRSYLNSHAIAYD